MTDLAWIDMSDCEENVTPKIFISLRLGWSSPGATWPPASDLPISPTPSARNYPFLVEPMQVLKYVEIALSDKSESQKKAFFRVANQGRICLP